MLEQEGFVHKHGAVWTHWADEVQHVIRFREIPELGLTQDYTYHVDRGRFDELLLKHAASRGSRVLQGARVEREERGAGADVLALGEMNRAQLPGDLRPYLDRGQRLGRADRGDCDRDGLRLDVSRHDRNGAAAPSAAAASRPSRGVRRRLL